MARTRIVRVTFQEHKKGDRIRNPKLELAKIIAKERNITVNRALAVIDLQNNLKQIS